MSQLIKILVIDDELILRNGIKYLCNWEDYGFTIVGEATNGVEGLRLIEELNPDIVITDIIMSTMDGIQLTQRIKEVYPSIKVVILSAYDNFDYVKTLFKLGVDDYLLKSSLEQDDLLSLLKRIRGSGEVARTSASQLFKKLLIGGKLSHKECMVEFQERMVCFEDNMPYVLFVGSGEQDMFQTTVAENLHPYTHTACISDDGLMCILAQAETENILDLQKSMESFIKMMGNTSSRKVLFAEGEPFGSLERLFQQYNTCIKLLEYGFYYPEKTLIQNEYLKNQMIEFPREAYLGTLDPIDLIEAFNILRLYLQQAAKQAAPDIFSLKRQIEEALYELIQQLIKAGFSMEEINRDKVTFFKQIESSQDYFVLDRLLVDIFQIFQSKLSEDIQKRENDLFIRLYAYIDENCHQDLKLSDIAKTFHLNYT